PVMMKFILNTLIIFSAATLVSAQSGRMKPAPSPTPTPNPNLRPSVIYVPTQQDAGSRPRVTPSPTPKTKDDGEEVLKVDANLVPIPVSVLYANGRAVTDLKLTDFDLKVDGRNATISDVFRSETPLKLALIFDNSSSVLIARDFEKEAAVKFFKRVIQPEKDMAALFSLADVTRLEQPFTKNVSLLVGAIERFPPPEGATALLDGIIEVADYLRDADGRR